MFGKLLRPEAFFTRYAQKPLATWLAGVQEELTAVPQTSYLHCESKKQDTQVLPITSPNIDRFSKFFHR